MSGRFYWLKLGTGFFNSEEVKVIQAQENGPAYIVFWLRLLCKAVEQDEPGRLRFREAIPYDEKLLSSVLDTDIDTVRSAMKLFSELGMLSVVEDGTIWIEAAEKMVGSESSSAERVRAFRERKKQLLLQCNGGNAQSNTELESEIEKEKEAEKEAQPSASLPVKAESTPDFDTFFASYPRKVERKKALKAWTARIKAGAAAADMIVAARSYADECERKGKAAEYIKHPSTFLGPNEPWLDYLARPATDTEGGTQKRICPSCGEEQDHNGQDCWNCGKPMKGAANVV